MPEVYTNGIIFCILPLLIYKGGKAKCIPPFGFHPRIIMVLLLGKYSPAVL
jgi:hypothetical protein